MRRAGASSLVTIGIVLAGLAVGAGASMAGAAVDVAPGAPTHLTVDDDAAPLAVTGDPAFGWVVRDADPGEIQSAYEIAVYDARDPQTPIADTGEVPSAQQSAVHVPGLLARLAPDRSYRWSVRTWDRAHRAGPYAPLASFDTGLRDADWQASWIRRPGAGRAGIEDYSLFRRDLPVAGAPVVRARVYASAGQQYQLRVNGVRVATGPSYAYPDEQYYETTDVTSLIRSGRVNTFAFVTFWGQPAQGRPASVPALIARITIEHDDHTTETLVTNGQWRTHAGMWVQGPPRNDEGDFVEHIDERKEPRGWDRPAFRDASWAAATVLGPHPTKPFRHLYAARTHIVEHKVRPEKVTHLADGSAVADFGAVISATPDVHVGAAKAGTHVVLVGGFALDPNGHVSRTKGIQDTNMTWEFDERAGRQDLRPFGYLAFRYLELVGAADRLSADDLTADIRHASLPDEHAASFTSSNKTLNAVWDLARHSALYDVQEQFVDTPTREKGPFLTDSYDVSQATMAAFGERNLTYQALRDFARSQTRYWPDGRVNAVYPNGDGKRDIPDATETYPEWVWHDYLVTGNRDTLAEFYPVVQRITDYVARAIDPGTGLVTKLPGGGADYRYGAVDWPPWMRYGYDMTTVARTTVNVLAVDDFARAAEMATALGRPGREAAEQTERATQLTIAINERLRRRDGVYVDGLEADGSQSTHASQQANAWALAYGIVPRASVQAVADHLVALGNAMGVPSFRVLLDALHDAGRDHAVVTALTDPKRPGYAQILQQGATFTWESWNAPAVGDSESHGWGSAVLAALQEDVLGVRTTTPGSADIDVTIPASGVTRAAGVVSTPRGPIPVSWNRDARSGRESVDITVPVGVVAHVTLPATDTGDVSDLGAPVTGHAGVLGASVQGKRTVAVTVGSGRYVLANTPPTRSLAPVATTTHSSSSPLALALGFAALVCVGVGIGLFLVVRRRARPEAGGDDRRGP